MPGIENLNLPSVSPYTSITSRFSQAFQRFVKDIADVKSKGEEDRIIAKEIAKLKLALLKPDTTPRQKKEQLVKLIYCEMLGHEVSFAYMEAVKFAQQQDLMHKRVAYVALGLFLDERNETECMMNIGSIQRDLKSTNILNICFGLIAASKLVYKDMMEAVLPSVIVLLKDKREIIRKKALMAMFQLWKINRDACDFIPHFHQALFDTDPSVMGASLIVYSTLIQEDTNAYKNLTGSFVSILKQILDRKMPEEYNYKNVPSPWMQIQLLKILAQLGSDDAVRSKQMYEVLRQCLETTLTDQTIGCSIVYECLNTVASIYVNRSLIETSVVKATIFLQSDDYNLKYLGIKALTSFVMIDASYASRHQQTIIDCLNDHDESLKRKTLELLYRMSNVSNVKLICEKMVQYLRSTMDDFVRADLVTRITTLAEKYAPDNEWYIETMNEVLELGGSLAPNEIAHNTMRIIGEGLDDVEDEDNDNEEENTLTTDLRRNAVFAYVNLLNKPILPDILIKLMCWVVGEYIDAEDGYDMKEIVDKLFSMLYRRFTDISTQSWVITCITKVLARCENPHELLRDVNMLYLTADAKQRYLELKAILNVCVEVQNILPYDASCEDIQVDENLSFLDDFVCDAQNRGARPYCAQTTCNVFKETKKGESGRIKFTYPETYPEDISKNVEHSPVNKSPTHSAHAPEQVPSPVQVSSPEVSRLTNKVTWTKEGRKRQPSNSEHPRGNDDENIEKSSNTSAKSSEITTTTSSSSESDFKTRVDPSMKSQKDETFMNELFASVGSNSNNTPRSTKQRKKVGKQSKAIPQHSVTQQQQEQQQNLDLLTIHPDSLERTSQQDLLGLISSSNELTSDTSCNTPKKQNLLDKQDALHTQDLLEGLDLQDEMLQPNLSLLITEESSDHSMQVNSPHPHPLETTINDPSLLTADIESLSETSASNLPKQLQEFKCTPSNEIASDICVRITTQNVYKPHELLVVFTVLNKTSNAIKDISFNIVPPSCLRGHAEELQFTHESELEGTSSFCHVVTLRYHSPSPHIVVNGHVSYRDYTNTRKKLFVNVTLQWNDILRPLSISTDVFGGKWLNKSLHERKHHFTIQQQQIDHVITTLENLNIQVIQEIGKETLAACKGLNGEEILFYFNITKLSVDLQVKSTSERLNDYVSKMISQAVSSS